MDILKKLANPNLIVPAMTSAVTRSSAPLMSQLAVNGLTGQNRQPATQQSTTSQYGESPDFTNINGLPIHNSLIPQDPVQSNSVVTPGSGYSPYTDSQVKYANDYANSVLTQTNAGATPQTALQTPQTPQAPTGDNSFDPGVAKRALINQYMTQKFGQTGMFDKQGYTQYSPEQLGSIQNSADTYFGGAIDEMQKLQDVQQQSKDQINIDSSMNEYQKLYASLDKYRRQNADQILDEMTKPGLFSTLDKAINLAQTSDEIMKNPNNAAKQIALLYSFVTGLDPQTGVKEGETDLVNSINSLRGTLGLYKDKILSGQAVSTEVATKLAEEGNSLAQKWKDAAARQQQRYVAKADVQGVRPVIEAFLKAGGSFDTATPQANPYISASATSQAVRSVIGEQESGNNYYVVNKTSGALGKYQMMPFNLPAYAGLKDTQANRQYFLNHPELQDKAYHAMMDDLERMYGGDMQKVTAHYYGGGNAAKAVGTQLGDRIGKYDSKGNLTGYPSINEYVSSVFAKANKVGVTSNQVASSQPTNSSYSGKLSSGLTYTVE